MRVFECVTFSAPSSQSLAPLSASVRTPLTLFVVKSILAKSLLEDDAKLVKIAKVLLSLSREAGTDSKCTTTNVSVTLS